MALIKCPECKNNVSTSAKTCPHCGFSISNETNNIIRIKIDNHPQVPGSRVLIRDKATNNVLLEVKSGSVAEIKSCKDMEIYFTGSSGLYPMLFANVSPKNGGKYRATWGTGIFSPKIVSCSRVDFID